MKAEHIAVCLESRSNTAVNLELKALGEQGFYIVCASTRHVFLTKIEHTEMKPILDDTEGES